MTQDKMSWTNEQWEEYLDWGHELGEDELSKRLDERDEVIDLIMNSDDYEYESPTEIIGLETEGKMDPKYGGVISYKTMPNGDHVDQFGDVISTRESRAKEDIPQWKKFEIGRLEILDNVVIPGPNALQKDIDQYGENIKLTKRHKVSPPKPTKIMPDDPNYTPLEKALNWAAETHHGHQHQEKWNRVAAALGADNGYIPMTPEEVEEYWNQHNRNKRWTMAIEALDVDLEEVAPIKIMPDDPHYTPLEKALNWASETHHGHQHQENWNRVAAALGEDNGYDPMTTDEVKSFWNKFGRNKRWGMAVHAVRSYRRGQ